MEIRRVSPSRELRAVVDVIPGVLSLEPYFAALFAVAVRLELESPSATLDVAA